MKLASFDGTNDVSLRLLVRYFQYLNNGSPVRVQVRECASYRGIVAQ